MIFGVEAGTVPLSRSRYSVNLETQLLLFIENCSLQAGLLANLEMNRKDQFWTVAPLQSSVKCKPGLTQRAKI